MMGCNFRVSDMLPRLIANMRARCVLLKRFGRDERGVSAVEFALLLPVMVLIYAGVVDVSRGVEANRKVNRVASMVGDLVSRQISVVPGQLDDIFNIGATLMVPSTKAPDIRISFLKVENLRNSETLVVNLDWSHKTRGFTEKGNKAEQERRRIFLPENLRQAEMNYIRVETQYIYEPLLSFVLPSISMEETYFISPRYSDAIPCADCK